MSNHAVDCSPPTNGGVGGGRSMLRPPAVLQSKNTTFYVFEALLLEHSSGGRSMLRPYSEHLTILTHPRIFFVIVSPHILVFRAYIKYAPTTNHFLKWTQD